MSTGNKKIVVIGGSHAGVAFIRAFEKYYAKAAPGQHPEITVIDKRNGMYFNVAGPRALVEPEIAGKTVLGYERLFKLATHVQATVSRVEVNQVVLEDGRTIPFDYLLVATGTSYPAPGKSTQNDINAIVTDLQARAQQVKAAQRIMVVGGGTLGVEIAGEIATEYPDKQVTLVHRGAQLCNAGGPFKEKFHKKLLEKLREKGVTVYLEDSVAVSEQDRAEGFRPETRSLVLTNSQTQVESDLQIFCLGNVAYNTDLLNSLEPTSPETPSSAGKTPAAVSENAIVDGISRRVNVRPTLQLIPDHLSHIFAAGDIANVDRNTLAFIAGQQGELVAKNMKALLDGKGGKLTNVKPSADPIAMVTVGRKGGQGQLPFGVVGDFLVRLFKAKDMMVGKFQGYAAR